MSKRLQIGDVIEIPTKKGLAYVQFSHEHKTPLHGKLIRVLPGFFQERPKDFQAIVNQKELYYTFIDIGYYVRRNRFEWVARTEVPERARAFPVFRNGQINPGKMEYCDNWWLWDGTRQWKIGKVTDDHLDMSLESLWNDVALVENIEEEWTPRRELELMAMRKKRALEMMPENADGYDHFLSFESKADAEKAKRAAKRRGLNSDIREDTSAGSVTLIAYQRPPLKNQVTVTAMKIVAAQAGGKYDRWQAVTT